MYNYAVQLVDNSLVKFSGVLFYPIYRNEYITGNSFLFRRIIKRNYIGISIMIKILLVYLQQISIRTKNIIQFIQGIAFGNNGIFYPLLYFYFIL